jgi:hypothetical protein
MNPTARAARQIIRVLKNRYVVTVLIILTAIFVWKMYVRANDDGYITGTVVDENGDAVAGATVFLQERDLVIVETPVTAPTDENGRFIFEDVTMVSFFLWAEKDGTLEAEKKAHHLYFKEQNYTLPEPIVLTRQ